MSIAEYIELIVSTRDAAGGHANNFIAVLFAYLVMAYLVSDKLTRAQTWAVSVIYSIFLFLPVNAARQDLLILRSLAANFTREHPGPAADYAPSAVTFPEIFITLAFCSWVLSICFVVQRRSKTLSGGA